MKGLICSNCKQIFENESGEEDEPPKKASKRCSKVYKVTRDLKDGKKNLKNLMLERKTNELGLELNSYSSEESDSGDSLQKISGVKKRVKINEQIKLAAFFLATLYFLVSIFDASNFVRFNIKDINQAMSLSKRKGLWLITFLFSF